MRDEARSVMTKQFQITLPSEWRNAFDIEKGDKIYAHYEAGSVLIITNEKISPLVEGKIMDQDTHLLELLIDTLIHLPGLAKTNELVGRLKQIVIALEA